MKSLVIGCAVVLLLVVGISLVGNSRNTSCVEQVAEKTNQSTTQVSWACE